MMAALAALLAPAGTAEAAKKKVKQPVVTKVTPMNASIGETLNIHGKYFRRGKNRNSVVFKRDGQKAVFVRADVATTKLIRVVLPAKLNDFLVVKDGVPQPTRFRIRVLAQRFGKSFTVDRRSPIIGAQKPPAPPEPPKAAADGDCDGDNVLNGVDADDDNDLLGDDLEVSLKLDPCKRDTDGDGIEDGYEYQSAIDLNDDQAQASVRPYPSKQPYPNPLFADADSDYDGDGLHMIDEYRLWIGYGEHTLSNMLYSDGKQYSRSIATTSVLEACQLAPSPSAVSLHCVNKADDAAHSQFLFLQRALMAGYSEDALLNMDNNTVPGISGGGSDYAAWWWDGSDTFYSPNAALTDVERYYYDIDFDGRLSDDERDEDADGLTNWVEAHGFGNPEWWKHVYDKEATFVNEFAGTNLTDPDSDGDDLVDGADDQDHDDLPNTRELRRQIVAGEVTEGAVDPCRSNLKATPQVLVYHGAPFKLGENPDGICWNRPSEGTDSEPVDNAPWRGWVQPFNPCLPNPRSRTCERYPNLGALYPPFDSEAKPYKVLDSSFRNPE